MTVDVTSDGPVLAGVRERLARSAGPPDPQQVADAVQASGIVLGSTALADLVGRVRAEMFGAGPLQALLDEPQVTDVLVNGPEEVWVDRGGGLERVPVALGNANAVRELAVRLAAAGGKRLDDASPTVDARLPDGTRLHAVIAPICPDGAVISLRTLRTRAFTVEGLISGRMVPPAWEGVLHAVISRRASFLVSGATGTGKTTVLATLLSRVDHTERIVTIEEARELSVDHPHVVPLTARQANVEGAGSVDLADLVRNALRMRPDRIVLGECRGAEVRDVLSALNTGHSGGCATIHANTAHDVPARLEALGALAGMSREGMAAQATSAFDAVLHLRRLRSPDGSRRRILSEIAVISRSSRGDLAVCPALTWDGRTLPRQHEEWARLAARLQEGE